MIARQVGTSVATAYRDVVDSIAQITREPAHELLTLDESMYPQDEEKSKGMESRKPWMVGNHGWRQTSS